MIDGFSFGVIPASHHPRVVCLSACASGYNCKNVHARGRQPPLPSHLLRFSLSSTASLCDWQAKAILGPVSLLVITSRRDNIAVCGAACRQLTLYQVRFRYLAILFTAVGLAIECSGIMDSGECLAASPFARALEPDNGLTSSLLGLLTSTRPSKRTSTPSGSSPFVDDPPRNRMDDLFSGVFNNFELTADGCSLMRT